MSLDRLTLGALNREITERVAGRRIDRVRSHGPSAIRLELSSRQNLVADVSRQAAGFWLIERAMLVADDREAEGPSRNALLLFRKHLEGERVSALATEDQRVCRLDCGRFHVRLQPHGGSGATLLDGDASVARFGTASTMAQPTGDTQIGAVDESTAAEFLDAMSSASADARRALLASRDPGLLPLLRYWPVSAEAAGRLADVLRGTAPPEPFLTDLGDDARHAERPPGLIPFEPEVASERASDFIAGAGALYLALRRAALFQTRRQALTARAKAECARYERLTSALERDRGRWPDPEELRRHAEALLAMHVGHEGARTPDGILRVADPRSEGGTLDVRLNPVLTPAQNANALYGRARNIEKGRAAFETRRADAERRRQQAESALTALRGARSLEDLPQAEEPVRRGTAEGARPRFLTSRGLEIVFGRNAAENHETTFGVARREDLWFHVLDAPGAHVILRNRDGRANQEDIQETAAVAAFLSERRTEAKVDVQYTERKHVHPAGGGKGRVRVTHAEVTRVAPLDPAARLRSR